MKQLCIPKHASQRVGRSGDARGNYALKKIVQVAGKIILRSLSTLGKRYASARASQRFGAAPRALGERRSGTHVVCGILGLDLG